MRVERQREVSMSRKASKGRGSRREARTKALCFQRRVERQVER